MVRATRSASVTVGVSLKTYFGHARARAWFAEIAPRDALRLVRKTLGPLPRTRFGRKIGAVARETLMLRIALLAAAVVLATPARSTGIEVVNDIERLTTNLSSKIWQKISLIEMAGRSPPGHPAPAAATGPPERATFATRVATCQNSIRSAG